MRPMKQAVATVMTAAMLTRDRTLPVIEPVAGLLPEGALVRGQTVACTGVAGASVAFALTVAATRAGAWVAAVDTPWASAEALAELGVPLERVVRVDSGGSRSRWADLVAAVVDGFELIVTSPPALTATLERRLRSKLAGDCALIIVGPAPGLTTDLIVATTHPAWEQAGRRGDGHLAGRRVELAVAARRRPRPHRAIVWLPDSTGRITLAEPTASDLLRPDEHPQSPHGTDRHIGAETGNADLSAAG